ncbi:MAG: hypothetical protein CBC48_16545 [bacterium TMED88]|nr:hydroxyacid dehydrogenase [Deltaproteobacteria bacterium]OUV25242.1 MAG: hypothetical protein CBC48_16545 [bacterium TMED88]
MPMLYISDVVEKAHGRQLDEIAPNWTRFVAHPDAGEPDYEAIDFFYFSGDIYPERVRDFAVAALKSSNLRWLHTFSAGVDAPFFQSLLKQGVRLTTSSGVHAVPIAQTVMLYLLALTRDLPGWLGDQSNRVWNPRPIGALQGLRAAVLGMGPIGYEISRLCRAMRMDSIGFRRTVQGDEPCTTYEMAEIDSHLPEMDVIILALPLTPETDHILDASRLSRLKPGVLIVNIGRGACIDEEALARGLRSGQVGGAGLDVFFEEPLPSESPLWQMPNVIITPHSSGEEPGNHAQATRIFLENAVRYQRGHPLLNAVAPMEFL